MPIAPIIPIMLVADCSLLSESSRKLPLVTTRSPAVRPSSTANRESALTPSFTSRGAKTPSALLNENELPEPRLQYRALGDGERSAQG